MRDTRAIVIPLLVALGVYIMMLACGPTTPEPTPAPTPTPVVVVVTATPVPPTSTPVPPTPTPTEEVSYEEYVWDEMGLSLTYPEGWVVEEGDTPDDGVILGPSDNLSVFLWIGMGGSAGEEAIQVQKDYNEGQGYENLVYGDLSEETWFGTSALQLGYDYDNQEGEHIAGGIYAWTTNEGYNYTAVLEVPADDEAAYDEINSVWKSIELTTPTAALPAPIPVPTEPPPTDTPTPPPPPPTPPPVTSPAQEHFEKGFEYFQQEKWDEAIAEFQEAIRLDPNFALAYMALGYSHVGKGELEQAIPALEKYLQLAPDADNRAQVEGDIEQMQTILASEPPPAGGPCCQPLQPGKGAIWFENHIGETVFADVGPNYYEIPGKQGDVAGCLCPQLDPGHYTLILHTGWGDARGEIDIVEGQTLPQGIR